MGTEWIKFSNDTNNIWYHQNRNRCITVGWSHSIICVQTILFPVVKLLTFVNYLSCHKVILVILFIVVQFLADFLVTVSNTGFPVTYEQQSSSFTRCGQYIGYPPAGEWGRVTCSPEPVRGRYVYVSIDDPTHWLTLCEVRVFGGMYRVYYHLSIFIIIDHNEWYIGKNKTTCMLLKCSETTNTHTDASPNLIQNYFL